MKKISTVKIPSPAIEDNGTPALPAVCTEPEAVADQWNVRLGAWTPPFPAPRGK